MVGRYQSVLADSISDWLGRLALNDWHSLFINVCALLLDDFLWLVDKEPFSLNLVPYNYRVYALGSHRSSHTYSSHLLIILWLCSLWLVLFLSLCLGHGVLDLNEFGHSPSSVKHFSTTTFRESFSDLIPSFVILIARMTLNSVRCRNSRI